MQRAKRIIDQITEAPVAAALPAQPPAIHQTVQKSDPVLSKDFINYLKAVENRGKAGFKNGRWFPHNDPSGGFNVGYGHHLQSDEEYRRIAKSGLTDQQVEQLLAQDILDAKKKVDDYIRKKYKVNLRLTPDQYHMLIDYVFNLGGLESFPKMVDAVLRSDKDKMKQEYKRTAVLNGKKKELTGRNTAFAQQFLASNESLA